MDKQVCLYGKPILLMLTLGGDKFGKLFNGNKGCL